MSSNERSEEIVDVLRQALDVLELCNGAETAEGVVIYTGKEITSLRQAIARAERSAEGTLEAEKQDKFCDDNCVWTDHHPDCVRASVSWKDMAFARLGVVRDKMHPDDVATVQRFLDGDYTYLLKRKEGV